ncbi:MAG: DoxX family protein [Ferruginibacter sp.]
MNYLQRLELWGDSHHSKWLDIIRVALGVFLIYKGISFLMNMSSLMGLMRNMGGGSFSLVLVGQFIVIVHLMGGLLIAIGLHTRLACLLQLPILIGAVILLNTSSGSLPVPSTEMFTSVLVLVLLICFLILGNGPWSFSEMAVEEKKNQNTRS